MMEQLMIIGFITILIGIMLIVISILTITKSKETKVEWAFGGFIGPFLFGFASKENWLKVIVVLSIVFLFVFILLNRKLLCW